MKEVEAMELRKVIKLILVLSNGQASVERGFSINKESIVENQKEKSIISQRFIYDYCLTEAGGMAQNIDVNKGLVLSCQRSNAAYKADLAEKKKEKEEEESSQKEKKKF